MKFAKALPSHLPAQILFRILLNIFARTFKMLESACGVVIYLYSVLPIKSTSFYMQFEMNILCELEMYLKLEKSIFASYICR